MIQHKAMQLVTALRSGKYKQGYKHLLDCNGRFCCLGIACDISDRKFNGIEWDKHNSFEWATNYLPPSVQMEFSFHNRAGGRKDQNFTVINNINYKSLADANDAGVSFEDIATYIETNWKDL